MSRSRRKRKLGKCICGRGHIPFLGQEARRHGRVDAACPVLDYPHQHNDKRKVFRRRREALKTEP